MKKILCLLVVGVTLTTSLPSMANDLLETLTTIGGAYAGARAGDSLGDGDAGAIVLGTVLGAMAGKAIGEELSDDDRNQMNVSMTHALNQPWQDDGKFEWAAHRGGSYRNHGHGYYNDIYCRDYVPTYIDAWGVLRPGPIVRMCQGTRGWYSESDRRPLIPYDSYRGPRHSRPPRYDLPRYRDDYRGPTIGGRQDRRLRDLDRDRRNWRRRGGY